MLCWLWGDLTRKRRELVLRLREQNEALRRDQDQRARLAAQDERTRIAREMHDIVAHSLSVVVVQADGAAYTAMHSGDFDREHAGGALTTIGTTAREALAETRRLVGVLRTADDEEGGITDLDYSPTDALTELPDLVDRMAASGFDVTLDAPSDLEAVPREAGLAAYRIVQESLTNAIKHAGPGARVRVGVATTGDELRVEVRDDGRGAAAPDDGRGHGLIGMRERAASASGTVVTGPAPGGGYRVAAALPLRPPQESR
nr:sensor histidine kinase [Janibacter cremeus]